MNFKYGYRPTLQRKAIRLLARAFVDMFALNSNTILATEIAQLIQPRTVVPFDGRSLFFRSGHGRLKWRAEGLLTEEPLMIDWLRSFRPDDIFLDIGANVGTYSIPAALKGKLVIAIELDPSNVFCLFSNIHLNKLYDKIIVVPIAVGTEMSVVDIFYRDFSIGDALQSVGRPQVLPTHQPAPFTVKQLCMSVDELFELYQLPAPTKIKIDVDGNEAIVLRGAWRTISKASEVYFEYNEVDGDGDMLAELQLLGFQVVADAACNVGTVKLEQGRNVLLRKCGYSSSLK